MTRLPKKNLIIAAALTVLFFLAFNFIFKPDGLANFFYKNSSSVQNFFWEKSQATIAFSRSYLFSYKLDEDNKKLLSENRQLLSRVAELNILTKENNALRRALDIGLKEKFVLAPCQLVSKESAGDFLVINAGRNQGMEAGQTVLSREGILVGKIDRAYDDFSRVIMISDAKSATDVEIQGKDFYALAKGQGNLKIVLDLVDKNKDVKEGDLLATSALGGVFPAGIALGKVARIQSQAAASFLQIEVEPLFKIEDLNSLFVIKNFKPLN
jgi:rod shape-determining protein MreC